MLYRLMLWIDLGSAGIAGIGLVRGLIQGDAAFAAKAILAILVWLSFALFCFLQIRRLRREADAMLEELRQLGYDGALAKARATSARLPRELVARKVEVVNSEWHAFERDEVQYVIVHGREGPPADVRQI